MKQRMEEGHCIEGRKGTGTEESKVQGLTVAWVVVRVHDSKES